MLDADLLKSCTTLIDGKWVIARPYYATFWPRLKDAWAVLIGEADAVRFYKQGRMKW